MRRLSIVLALVLPACGAGLPPNTTRPLTHRPELGAVRVYIAPKAELTWSDPDCQHKHDPLAAAFAQKVAGDLSRVGFSVVSEPKDADAVVHVRASLAYCGMNGDYGPGTVSMEPGAVVSWDIGHNHAVPDSEFWHTVLVEKLVDAPQVKALVAQKQQAPGAGPAGAPPAAAPHAPSDFVTGTTRRDAYALVVGVEKYRDAPSPAGARHDAETFKSLATRTLGVPDANVRLLLDDRASKTDVERELVWLKGNVPPGGRLFFFFAGHGTSDAGSGTAYLLPYDGSPDAIGPTGLMLANVLRGLGETRAADVVAFVDACYSGAGGRSVLAKGARPLVRVKETPTASRVALYAAAGASQVAGPNTAADGGLFTSVLADGVGHGAADIDGDGAITLDEIGLWVTPRVVREAQRQSREQRPALTLPANTAAPTFVVATGIAR